jgi:hypothetical protein
MKNWNKKHTCSKCDHFTNIIKCSVSNTSDFRITMHLSVLLVTGWTKALLRYTEAS